MWLITAGGALFAAWPLVYMETSFSSLYVAMYLALISLWLRPLAPEYRAKIDNDQWRKSVWLAISVFRLLSADFIWCRIWQFNARAILAQ